MAKTQVGPHRAMTIPRLVLQACCMAVKLAQFLVKQLDLAFLKISFWTCSSVALAWIKTESRFLKPFVANRVASIQESTEMNQWHHISGKKNPADIASRGIDICELNTSDNTWFLGPEFLRQSVDQWPSSEQAPDYTAVKVE